MDPQVRIRLSRRLALFKYSLARSVGPVDTIDSSIRKRESQTSRMVCGAEGTEGGGRGMRR